MIDIKNILEIAIAVVIANSTIKILFRNSK